MTGTWRFLASTALVWHICRLSVAALTCDPATSGTVVHEGFNTTAVSFPTTPEEPHALVQGCVGNYSAGNSWQTPLEVACLSDGSYAVVNGTATCEIMLCDIPRYDNGAEESFEALSSNGTDSPQTTARLACESHYGPGRCKLGQCGDNAPLSPSAPAGMFYYYYFEDDASCECDKAVGSYEWIFANDGYTGACIVVQVARSFVSRA